MQPRLTSFALGTRRASSCPTLRPGGWRPRRRGQTPPASTAGGWKREPQAWRGAGGLRGRWRGAGGWRGRWSYPNPRPASTPPCCRPLRAGRSRPPSGPGRRASSPWTTPPPPPTGPSLVKPWRRRWRLGIRTEMPMIRRQRWRLSRKRRWRRRRCRPWQGCQCTSSSSSDKGGSSLRSGRTSSVSSVLAFIQAATLTAMQPSFFFVAFQTEYWEANFDISIIVSIFGHEVDKILL